MIAWHVPCTATCQRIILSGNAVKAVGLWLAAITAALAYHAPAFSDVTSPAAAIAKVRAYQWDGTVTLGSAVQTGPEKLVTNCHVVYAAQRVEIVHDRGALPAKVEAADVYHDLCMLRAAPSLGAPAVTSESVAVGDPVIAVGFPGGRDVVVTHGHVVALHEYEGAKVIQVSAPFDKGASGGGLFDSDGRLIGILAFKASAGGSFHFALPVSWLAMIGDARSVTSDPYAPFWQQTYGKLPYFLRAISIQLTQAAARSAR